MNQDLSVQKDPRVVIQDLVGEVNGEEQMILPLR